jgi:hypothetical protein
MTHEYIHNAERQLRLECTVTFCLIYFFKVHGFCGMWGLIAAGLFAQEDLLRTAYESEPKGFGKQLRNQFLGAAVIGTWTIVLSGLMFISNFISSQIFFFVFLPVLFLLLTFTQYYSIVWGSKK